jgi:hypothetical protein
VHAKVLWQQDGGEGLEAGGPQWSGEGLWSSDRDRRTSCSFCTLLTGPCAGREPRPFHGLVTGTPGLQSPATRGHRAEPKGGPCPLQARGQHRCLHFGSADVGPWVQGTGDRHGTPCGLSRPTPDPVPGKGPAARRGEAVLTHHQGPPGLEPRKQWPVSRAFVPGSSLLGATLRSPGSSAHFAPRDRKPDLWPTQSRGRHKMSP